MDELIFSVVICTHNRADYLARSLLGIAKQDFPADRYEVLIVDNASSDDTRQRVELLQSADRPLRYIYESQLGLSVARNKGWKEATGKYIAYLDDDAIPSETWLKSASDTLEKGPKDIGILGGPVLPIWESERPRWLSDQMLSLLSMVDLGPEPQYVDGDFGIVGANMIIPRDLLERCGGFSSKVGRVGSSLLSSEEVLLKRQLASFGFRGYYTPDAWVEHHAPAERLTKAWFLERNYWQGRSSTALTRLEGELPRWKRLFGCGLEICKAATLFAASSVSANGFELRARAQSHWGKASGLIS